MPTRSADILTWDRLAPLLIMLLLGMLGWGARESYMRQRELETILQQHMIDGAAAKARNTEMLTRLDRMQQQINMCMQNVKEGRDHAP